jgi:adenylosuccinate synthase
MKTSIVIGLQYGDEGKGIITSFLSKSNDLVVRFNGGHQAGHTVVKNGHRHIFSSFGSGAMNGAHTYWSEYCTFYPKSFYNERESLISYGFNPVHFIHPLSMITTPFDIDYNRQTEDSNKHGSVGMGFGATIARNENTPFKLYAIDLTYREILTHKLYQIANYYKAENIDEQIESFLEFVDKIELNISTLSEIKNDYEHVIFEGAQGIMLDMDFGFFPNVTRSNTTSKNAMQIIKDSRLPKPEIYYVMRSYLTRHGIGFMPNETSLNFEDLTNKTHQYQGRFRQGYHSLDQLKYAIKCDSIFSGNENKNLAIICLDQTGDNILIESSSYQVNTFLEMIGMAFNGIVISKSPHAENVSFENIDSIKVLDCRVFK